MCRAVLLSTLALVALLAPIAGAQTAANPIQGSYHELYMVTGRVIDGDGSPVAGGTFDVSVVGPGISSRPFGVRANCYGDFIGTFKIRQVDPTMKVVLTLRGSAGGVENVTTEAKLDPFYRRSDLLIQAEGEWGLECPDQTALYEGRLSVAGRIVNRTEPYEVADATYHARPFTGEIAVWLVDEQGNEHCPPAADGDHCIFLATDERGDYRYSFTFENPMAANGHMRVDVENKSYTFPIDPVTRMAVGNIELSGQGAPEFKTPMPGTWALLVAACVGVAARSVLLRGRR